MADIKSTLSILAVQLAERAAAATEFIAKDATEAYKTGLNTAISLLEQAAQKVQEPHPLDRFRELAKLWRDIQVGRLNAAAGDLTGIRYALDQCSDQLIAVLEGTPVEATFWSGAIPGKRYAAAPEPKTEASTKFAFMTVGSTEPTIVDVRDVVSVTRHASDAYGLNLGRMAELRLKDGRAFVIDGEVDSVLRTVVAARKAVGCTQPLMGDLCAPHQPAKSSVERIFDSVMAGLEGPPPAAPKPTAPTLTKCEQLIYDVAVKVLAEPSLHTRAQMTQQIDYWLYQLQNANLARQKPEVTPVTTGVAG